MSDLLRDLAAAALYVGIRVVDRALAALPARGRSLGEAMERGRAARAFPVAESDRIRRRLIGARYELEEALREERDLLEDQALDNYLTDGLLGAEGAVQRLDQMRETAACTPP